MKKFKKLLGFAALLAMTLCLCACLDDDYDDYTYEDDEDYGCSCSCGSDDAAYEVTCPTCGAVIGLNENDLGQGGMECPKCGETLEFDFDEDELDDTDDDEKSEEVSELD